VARRDAKIDVRNIVSVHRRTYVVARTNQPRLRDHLLLEVTPALVAGGCLLGDVRLQTGTAVGLLTVSGILSALFFGVLLQVSDRAMNWADAGPTPGEATSDHATFLEELAANAGYAALVCIAAAAVYVAASVSSGWPLRVYSAIGIGLGAHLVLVLLMVMKRVFALTQERLNRARTGAGLPRNPHQRAS
jgi:hypothetical protein